MTNRCPSEMSTPGKENPSQGKLFKMRDLMTHCKGFPWGSDGKGSARNVVDPGLIPGPGISPGEGNGNPLQYLCLENSMDRGALRVTVESDMTELLTLTVRWGHYSVGVLTVQPLCLGEKEAESEQMVWNLINKEEKRRPERGIIQG